MCACFSRADILPFVVSYHFSVHECHNECAKIRKLIKFLSLVGVIVSNLLCCKPKCIGTFVV